MKTSLHSAPKYLQILSFLLMLLLCCSINVKAQTTCTNNPASCASAITDLNATFVNVTGASVSTVGTGSAPMFTLLPAASNTTNMTINSGQYLVTTDNCVLVTFIETRIGLSPGGPTNVSIVLPDNTVITCPNVSVNPTTGRVCIQLCDPRIVAGQLIRVRLAFEVAAGNFNNESIILSAFAVLNLATNTSCAASFICLDGTSACSPCDPNFSILTGKIRVFFTTPIPIGTPTPQINAASTVVGGITTSLTQFNFCISGDAGTTVARTYVDYCVYTNLLGSTLPTSNLVLSFQTGALPVVNCPVSLPVLCPTGFTTITDNRPCLNCDPAFPTASGKIRIFFPTPIPAGVPDPIISAIAGAGVTAGTLKFCVLSNGGTNIARTYADYCVYTNGTVPFDILLTNALSFSLRFGNCGTPQVCVVNPIVVPPCTFTTYAVIDNGNGGGIGGGLGLCPATSSCSGSTVYLASRLRINLASCLPAGVPAPTISSFQTVNFDGSISALNQDYCFVVSDESAALISTERCFIEYCVYARVNGNTFFVNPPVNLMFNTVFNATLGGQSTPITVSCPGPIFSGPTPVTIINFDYQIKNCGVNLRWSTAQETNSKEFVVQNSTDGTTWSDVGKVRAQGISGVKKDYSFMHPNPVNGQNFYRFAAVDFDGTTKYSEVLSPKINCGKAEISVHPNPFTDVINVYFTSQQGGNVSISLRDNTGRTLYNTNRTVQRGSNTIMINSLSQILKGVYIISVKTDDAIINQKLIK